MINKETIAAPATSSGALFLVRISGKESIDIVENIFRPVNSRKILRNQKSHSVHLGYLSNNGKDLDKVLVSLFRSPHSYTGEDMVEISCHGSSYIRDKLLQLLLEKGARMARPGEFTMRAFINGKMDLSQAEAVADLISAESESSHRIAMMQMRGGIFPLIKELRKELLQFASIIELELDFSEENVEFSSKEDLYKLLDKLENKLKGLIDSFSLGNAIKQGVSVVLVGAPNSGKSTLFNALLKENRSIVSKIPGTTRDVIEESLILDGIRFRFIDTAGIRQTEDDIEKISIQKTIEIVSKSQLIIYLFDATSFEEERILNDISKIRASRIFIVANKIDIVNKIDLKMIDLSYFFQISAKLGIGINGLKNALSNFVSSKILDQKMVISQWRHYEAFIGTLDSIYEIRKGLELGLSEDLVAMDIRQALHFLGEVTGDVSPDNLLENIFSKFCIGK
ncbi:MAG TPA: tRNA uridine-5-carboxymethylaminomethyl(34) synthesis GTPase MnmE [Blattabacteriaceae bacterium]